MARTGLLKKQLKNQQLIDTIEKSKSVVSQPKAAKAAKPAQVEPESESSEEIEVQETEPLKSKNNNKKEKKEKIVDPNDYSSQTLSKKEQRKLKKLQSQIQEVEAEDESDNVEQEESEEEDIDFDKLAASESESDIDDESNDEDDESDDEDEENVAAQDAEEEEDEEEEDVPLSDAEIDSDADVVPHTKLTINNTAALRESLARIELPWAKHSFQEHQSIVSAENTESLVKDIYDDTERELAFYKQGLDAVKQSRLNLLKLKVPFSRPLDYFAEMVKSDEHMDKLKNKLLAEAANVKASEEAKRQRNLKKFGKQVQHETLQKRAKEKKESLEKIKSLKKKRGGNELNNDDEFQIALEEATREEQRDGKSYGNKQDNKRAKPNTKRLAKDSKYGQGGMKRFKRSNDADSSADVSGFSNKKSKNRPGKSRRRQH